MKKVFAISLSLLLISFLFAQESKYKTNNVLNKMYITSVEGLCVRDEPSLKANKICALIYCSEVQVLQIGNKINIDGITDNWVKIEIPRISWSVKSDTGWVFGGYLSEKTNNSITIKYEKEDICKYSEDYQLTIKTKNNFPICLLITKNEEVIIDKNISGYCFNNNETKLYFYSQENYLRGKKIWEMENFHYSFYEVNLKTMEITEILQSKTIEGGYGIRLSADEKYLCYPEAGGKIEAGPSKCYVSLGVGAIFDLDKKITKLKREHTNFYPISNGFYLGRTDNFYYYLYDNNFNFLKDINLYKLANIVVSDEYYLPSASIIYNNSYPYFFTFSSEEYNYKVHIYNNEITVEPIKKCIYEDFIKINNDVYCLLAKRNSLEIFDKSFSLINKISYLE